MVGQNNTEGCKIEKQDYQEKEEKHSKMPYKNLY